MKEGYSCYYLCLVGVLPTDGDCRRFGGCGKCGYYLKDPERRSDKPE